MSTKLLNQRICLRQYLSEKEYQEIAQLEEFCSLHDKTNLKLELDYRYNMQRNSESVLKEMNEFLYYDEDVLVAYLCIGSFGGRHIGELNGVVHPNFRRQGLFKKLFELAIDECQKRKFNKILLLTDNNSTSGIEFIKSVNGEYDFSEYRMSRFSETTFDSDTPIRLRPAGKLDGKEIARQNAIYFNQTEVCECFPEEEEKLNKITYMVELEEKIIGKIKVTYSDDSAFISGVGILPDFRGKGYGKAALKEALRLIHEKNIYQTELDVECKNSNALNIYKSCGFEEESVMNYYRYTI